MTKLEGKVAVITGGNSGIGLATAQRFVAEGAYVFITGRRQNELDAAVKQIGKNVTAVQGDVSNLADLDRLYDTVKQDKGHIDILFANAGTGEFGPPRHNHRRAFRQDIQRQRQRSTVHCTKGPTASKGWKLHHSECVHRFEYRIARAQRIQRIQSRRALLRAHFHLGSKRPQNPCERSESWRDSFSGLPQFPRPD